MSDIGHHYDDTNLCIYCDRCPDPECCEQVECDRRCVPDVEAVTQRMLERFAAHPHEEVQP